jgi:hypothetical protein
LSNPAGASFGFFLAVGGNTPWHSPSKNPPSLAMNKLFQASDDSIPPGQPSAIRQPQWVQCDNSIRRAVRNKSGTWKSFSNDRELVDFVKVCPVKVLAGQVRSGTGAESPWRLAIAAG